MTTKEHDINSFKACASYADLNNLMIRVVKRQIRSPVYGFDEIGGDSDSDNHWWSGPRYEKLVRINELGVITFNAEEGMEQNYGTDFAGSPINYRCSLYCLIAKTPAAELFFDAMKRDGFHVIKGDAPIPQFKREKLMENSPLRRFPTSSNVTGGLSDDPGTAVKIYGEPPRTPSFASTVFLEALSPSFGSTLLTFTAIEFVVVDPFYNRPAHSATGLYTTIIKNLGGSASNQVAW